MDRQPLVLRAARPTFEEGLVFARYLDQAAEGFFRFLLGRRAESIVAKAYTQPDNDYSFQNVVFAEDGQTVVGMASGYTAELHRRSSGGALEKAAGNRSLRMVGVALLCAPILRVLDTLADGDFYLQAIAMDQELRGRGVGSKLIDLIEDRAVAAGSARLALDVSATNEGACRLYERRGMTVESQWPRRLVIPGLRILRMTKIL